MCRVCYMPSCPTILYLYHCTTSFLYYNVGKIKKIIFVAYLFFFFLKMLNSSHLQILIIHRFKESQYFSAYSCPLFVNRAHQSKKKKKKKKKKYRKSYAPSSSCFHRNTFGLYFRVPSKTGFCTGIQVALG